MQFYTMLTRLLELAERLLNVQPIVGGREESSGCISAPQLDTVASINQTTFNIVRVLPSGFTMSKLSGENGGSRGASDVLGALQGVDCGARPLNGTSRLVSFPSKRRSMQSHSAN